MWTLFVIILTVSPTGERNVSIEAADRYDRPSYNECRTEAQNYKPKNGTLLQAYCIKRNEQPTEKRI